MQPTFKNQACISYKCASLLNLNVLETCTSYKCACLVYPDNIHDRRRVGHCSDVGSPMAAGGWSGW